MRRSASYSTRCWILLKGSRNRPPWKASNHVTPMPRSLPGRSTWKWMMLHKLERRPELDALRGLFLVWMTLTHLPTRFSDFVNQPIGFVSSAEGFVFISALLVGRLYIRELVQNPANVRCQALEAILQDLWLSPADARACLHCGGGLCGPHPQGGADQSSQLLSGASLGGDRWDRCC